MRFEGIAVPGASRIMTIASVTALLSAGAMAQGAMAQGGPGRVAVAGLRAKDACVKEDVRITGFAAAREEAGASLASPGYRATEILVSEGDKVTSGQELLRALREGAGDAAGGKSGGTSLRAPISGVVVKVNVRVGDVSGAPAAAGAAAMSAQGGQPDPQFLISAGPSVDLIADVPSVYAAQIRKGAVARVVSDEGVEAKGVVQSPASEVDPVSQLGRARLSIEPASALRSGQFASATIETAQDCGVTVPLSAVNYRGNGATVQVLAGSTVETRHVRTGLSDGAKIRIHDGVSEGEVVAIHAGTALRPGDNVTPIMVDGSNDARKPD